MSRAERAIAPIHRLPDEEIERLYYSARHYVKLKDRYLGME